MALSVVVDDAISRSSVKHQQLANVCLSFHSWTRIEKQRFTLHAMPASQHPHCHAELLRMVLLWHMHSSRLSKRSVRTSHEQQQQQQHNLLPGMPYFAVKSIQAQLQRVIEVSDVAHPDNPEQLCQT